MCGLFAFRLFWTGARRTLLYDEHSLAMRANAEGGLRQKLDKPAAVNLHAANTASLPFQLADGNTPRLRCRGFV